MQMSDYLVSCMQSGDLRSIRDYVKLLSSVNAYVYNDDDNNLNILHLAAGLNSEHRDSIIELLFDEMNVDPNYPGRSEKVGNIRAIHLCGMWGYDSTLKLLLLHGADASLRDNNNWSPVDYASIFDNYVCISILLRYGSINCSPTDWAAVIDSSLENSSHSITSAVADLSINNSSSPSNRRRSNSILSSQKSSSQQSKIVNFSGDETSSLPASNNASLVYFDLNETHNLNDTNNNNNNSNHNNEFCSYKNNDDNNDDENDAESSWDRINEADLNLSIADVKLRQELIYYGHKPGPITDTTRRLYIKLLYLLKRRRSDSYVPSKARQLANSKSSLAGYSAELESVLSGKFSSRVALSLEREFLDISNSTDYQGPKQFFNYILVDPRITQNIPEQVMDASDSDTSSIQTSSQDARKVMQRLNRKFNPQLFAKFIRSIFYIGKGQKKRDLMHLFDAVAERDSITKAKIERIRDIWAQGYGVVSLHLFHNITSKEALTREALMIETIGLRNLTNILKGSTQFKLSGWNEHRRKLLGSLLLLRAYTQLLNEGERQIRRHDLRI